MRYTREVRVRLSGYEDVARTYIGRARTFLGQLISTTTVWQNKRTIQLPNGVVITVWFEETSIPIIHIYAPFVPVAGRHILGWMEAEEEGDDLFYAELQLQITDVYFDISWRQDVTELGSYVQSLNELGTQPCSPTGCPGELTGSYEGYQGQALPLTMETVRDSIVFAEYSSPKHLLEIDTEEFVLWSSGDESGYCYTRPWQPSLRTKAPITTRLLINRTSNPEFAILRNQYVRDLAGDVAPAVGVTGCVPCDAPAMGVHWTVAELVNQYYTVKTSTAAGVETFLRAQEDVLPDIVVTRIEDNLQFIYEFQEVVYHEPSNLYKLRYRYKSVL